MAYLDCSEKPFRRAVAEAGSNGLAVRRWIERSLVIAD